LANQVCNRAHALFERRIRDGAVKVQDVEVVGAKTLQARLDGLHNPLARLALLVRALRGRIAEFCGDHPTVASIRNRAADDFLRASCVINVSCVDEIDALVERFVDDALRGCLIGLATKHHGPQAQG
jgi:hypothetical protein